jgi:hypothetical protein
MPGGCPGGGGGWAMLELTDALIFDTGVELACVAGPQFYGGPKCGTVRVLQRSQHESIARFDCEP